MATNRLVEQPERRSLRGVAILVTGRRVHNRTRSQAVRCALDGLQETWRTQPNFRLQLAIGGAVFTLGLWVRFSSMEWLWVSFAVGLVIFAELMNTAIERTVDLVVGLRPDPLARYVKDVSAASVFIAALLALFIGVMTFLPHFTPPHGETSPANPALSRKGGVKVERNMVQFQKSQSPKPRLSNRGAGFTG